MSMNESIAIGNNAWAAFGLGIFTIFAVIFLVAAVAFVVFAYRPEIIGFTRRETVYYAALLVSLFTIMASLYAPYFFEFTTIKITPGGAWELRNAWSLPLATLAPGSARTVSYGVENITWYGKSYSSYDAARLYIVTNNRIYYSRSNIDLDSVQGIATTLQEKARADFLLESSTTATPFSVLVRWQRIHFWLLILFAVVLLSPLVLFRKEK